MPSTPDDDAVAADDQLVEQLRAGKQLASDRLSRLLTAWRDDCNQPPTTRT